MTNYERGREREYRSMRYLEAAGYRAHRTAGSHGEFDVIGIAPSGIVLVQCKFNCRPTSAELEAIREYPAPANCQKLIHLYVKGRHAPEVVAV